MPSPSPLDAVLRAGVRRLLHFTTHLYFSRVEVRGLRNLQGLRVGLGDPAGGAGTSTNATTAIFAGNHPSGLVDPMVIMSALPRAPMSSVAKASLFETPVVRHFLRAMRAVPVAQPYDPGLPPDQQASPAERAATNARMFRTVASRLTAGGDEAVNIVIFPEGTCHSTPQIKQMRAGTARMALQVAAGPDGDGTGPRIPIVPVGLSYSVPSGAGFRGKVLVDFGRPIRVTDDMLADFTSGDHERALLVEERLMKRVERHLRHVTIRTPDWVEELERRERAAGRAAPVYTMQQSRGLRRQESRAPERDSAGGVGEGTGVAAATGAVLAGKTTFGPDAAGIDEGPAERVATFLEGLRSKIDSGTAAAAESAALAGVRGEYRQGPAALARVPALAFPSSPSSSPSSSPTTQTAVSARTDTQRREMRQQVRVTMESGRSYFSRVELESATDARKRRSRTSRAAAEGSPEPPPRIPLALQRQAARNAFFREQGIAHPPRDWEFINAMHLARHIYKPEGETRGRQRVPCSGCPS